MWEKYGRLSVRFFLWFILHLLFFLKPLFLCSIFSQFFNNIARKKKRKQVMAQFFITLLQMMFFFLSYSVSYRPCFIIEAIPIPADQPIMQIKDLDDVVVPTMEVKVVIKNLLSSSLMIFIWKMWYDSLLIDLLWRQSCSLWDWFDLKLIDMNYLTRWIHLAAMTT